MFYIPSWKNEYSRVAAQRPGEGLGSLYSQLNSIILNCRNRRLRDPREFSELILA
jgi:hypothetical protein